MAARANASRKRDATTCPLMVNDAGVDLCTNNWYLCNDSEGPCSCSGMTYLLAAACQTCAGTSITWGDYTGNLQCTGFPQQFPSPLPTGTNAIPSWAIAMISATPTPTTFDLAAASGFLSSLSTSTSPPRTSSPLDPSETTKPAVPSSTSSPTLDPSNTTALPSSHSSLNPTASSSPSPISSDTAGSPSQTVMSTSSAISSTNILGSATPTKGLKDPMRRDMSIGAIIGIVIAICSIITLGALLVWFRRRRRRQNPHIVATPYPILLFANSPLNNNSADSPDTRSISKVRQQFLRNELRAAQENIIHIQNLERQTASLHGRAGRILRLLSSRRASSTGSGSPTPAILRLRERNEMLKARIRELEAQLDSPWALGLSDEPPPGYVE